MEIKEIKTSEINPAKYNPRQISDAAFEGLKESIKKFGMPQPIVVNIRDGANVIVGGHMRLRAAEALGWETVPVIEVDLSPAEEKALNVTLNNKHIAGEYTEALGDLLAEIRLDLGDDFMKDLRLDDIELPDIEMLEPRDIQNTSQELNVDSFDNFAHNCPKCGFGWNDA
jgi:hypothetical protein